MSFLYKTWLWVRWPLTVLVVIFSVGTFVGTFESIQSSSPIINFLQVWLIIGGFLLVLSTVPFLLAHWCGVKIEKFVYRRTGGSVISILTAVFAYLILCPIFFIFLSSIMVGLIQEMGDPTGYGLLISYLMILFLPIMLVLWIGFGLLLIRDIKSIRISVGYVPKKNWLIFLPFLIILGAISIFFSIFFLLA